MVELHKNGIQKLSILIYREVEISIQLDSVMVDLQSVDNVPGYGCLDEVQRPRAKSLDRTNEPVIMKPIKI